MRLFRRAWVDMNALKAIDLFSGVGGLSLGLKRAGFKVVAAIESNTFAVKSYRANHRNVLCVQADIRQVDVVALRKGLGLEKGELALIAGCPPCQGFSTLRTRKKVNSVFDSRNSLLFEFLRFVDEFEPKAVMMENVPALASDRRLMHLLKELKLRGYSTSDGCVSVVDAADYGVPQRRRRMLLQVVKGADLGRAKKASRVTVRAALNKANLGPAGTSGDPLHDLLQRHSDRVMRVIKAIPKDGGSRDALPQELVLPCHKRRPNSFGDVYGRMAWDDVAPTITGGCTNPSKGRFIHPSEDRAVTLREAAVLQTFPKNYRFSLDGGRDRVALMIGNALPPQLIRRHAQVIAKWIMRNAS